MPRLICSFLGILVVCVLTLPASGASRIYRKICEASGAALVDRSHVAVASDDYHAIIIYERGNPEPISEYDLGDSVSDIEAGARLGDTIYWITSHSLNKNGEEKKKRKLLFATRINPDGTLSGSGTVYRDLRRDISLALGETEETLAGRFNIEGMADTPEGHLLVGLRGPKTKYSDEAILVRIQNPQELISSNKRAIVSAPIALDLSDGKAGTSRGIRDIARVGNRYLIVAGPEPDGDTPKPRLFWWDGKSSKAMPGPEVDFSGMTPEAIVVWSEHEAEILSDNGGAMIDGTECSDKDPPAKAFFPALDVDF